MPVAIATAAGKIEKNKLLIKQGATRRFQVVPAFFTMQVNLVRTFLDDRNRTNKITCSSTVPHETESIYKLLGTDTPLRAIRIMMLIPIVAARVIATRKLVDLTPQQLLFTKK